IVYSANGSIYKATTSVPISTKPIGAGAMARINDAGDIVSVSGNLNDSGDVHLLSGPSYAQDTPIHRGSWADVNNGKQVIFEDSDAQGVRQLYLYSRCLNWRSGAAIDSPAIANIHAGEPLSLRVNDPELQNQD